VITEQDQDVLVAGAGPAGAHTALRLARQGLRVALIDSRHFPRKKPCGEFLSPACVPLLEELELLSPLYEHGAVRVTGMRLHAGLESARGDYVAFGRHVPPSEGSGHGLGIRREVLDHLAVRTAQGHEGIRVLLGWRVLQPLIDRSGRVQGLSLADPSGKRVELRARFVVGADGARSRVASGLGWSGKWEGQERFAIVARFRGVPPRSEAEVHILEGGDYFAACPIDAGLFTANLVVDRQALSKGAAGLTALFRERLARAPALAERLARAELVEALDACGPLRRVTRRCTGPGVALVGDACGFVDPLTGEGLFFAMRGAALLARALERALREPRRERAELRRYEQARRREFSPRYGLAGLLQRGLRRPGVPEVVIGALRRRPGLCDLVLGLTGDYLPPGALLSPVLWRRALRVKAGADDLATRSDG
jgi:flavin-dependent dehydrogenase